MPTYALLGATGATGSSVLRHLLAEPPKGLKLNILVRSRNKLLQAFPHLEETSAFEIRIIQGTSTESGALQKCLAGADAILVCVGTNDSRPGQSLMYDTAAAIVDTLKSLQKIDGNDYQLPTVLMLRAGPLNEFFAAHIPAPARFMLNFCLHFGYADLKRGADFYGSAVNEYPGLLQVIFVDPPALHDAPGTERTGYEVVVNEQLNPMLSYADLGAAFCELAERREEFKGKGVGVGATGKVKTTWVSNVRFTLNGAKNRILHAIGLL